MNLMCFLLPSVKDKPLAGHHNKVCGLCYVAENKKKGHTELIKRGEKKKKKTQLQLFLIFLFLSVHLTLVSVQSGHKNVLREN